jgi:hypothetical protein
MALDTPQFPNSVSKKTTNVKITRPGAEVGISTERSTLHHDGQHVSVQGPARMSGKGTAKELGHVFKAIRESHK